MTPNTATGKSPAEFLFQRQPRSMLHRLVPGSNKPRLVGKDETASADKKVKSFGEDDPVWIKNHGEGEKWIAGIVVKRIGAVNYHVVTCGGSKILHRHVDHLTVRVPNLGKSVEAPQPTPARSLAQTAGEEVVIQEGVRRSGRVREAPAWAQDYEMSTN